MLSNRSLVNKAFKAEKKINLDPLYKIIVSFNLLFSKAPYFIYGVTFA